MANGQKDVECVGSSSYWEGGGLPILFHPFPPTFPYPFRDTFFSLFWPQNTIVDVMCNCYMSMSMWGYEWVGSV